MTGRDRDARGRARNARPRDRLGRVLPRGAEGTQRVPEDLVLPPEEALAEAQHLLDTGLPFHAHEVLEGVWKSAAEPHRELWRGLAQLAVGVTHLERGNPTGAAALLRRAADRLEPYRSEAPHRVDAGGLADWARDVADSATAAGASVSAGPPPRLIRLGTKPSDR